jgi:DNA-binding MarR family transcriptional regulator
MTIALKMRNRAEKFAIRPDLTAAQARAIGFIERIEATEHRGVIQRELAEVTRTTAASVSSLIDGLERNGYVERRPSANDIRRNELHVLPKARGLAADFDRQMEQAETELLRPLTTAQRTTLLELLRRIDEHFDPAVTLRGLNHN